MFWRYGRRASDLSSRRWALRSPSASGDGQVMVPGTVARKAFLGDLMRYWVTVDGREWIVDQPDPGAATPYDGAVQIAIRPERIHVIAEAPV